MIQFNYIMEAKGQEIAYETGYRAQLMKVSVSAALVILVLLGLMVWLMIDGKKIAFKVGEERKNILVQNQLIVQLSGLKKQHDEAVRIAPFLKPLLPDTDRLLSIPGEVESLAERNGLSGTFSFGAEAPAQANEPSAISANISLVGSVNGFRQFLVGLEALSYTLNVVNIEVLRQEGNNLAYSINTAGRLYKQ